MNGRRHNRPSAFEVSFPEEAAQASDHSRATPSTIYSRQSHVFDTQSPIGSGYYAHSSPATSVDVTTIKGGGSEGRSLSPGRGSTSGRSESLGNGLKRKGDGVVGLMRDPRIAKRIQLPPTAYYSTTHIAERETRVLIVPGEHSEDSESEYDSERESDEELFSEPELGSSSSSRVASRQRNGKVKEKPIRILADFCVFNPRHRNELVSLAELDVAEDVLEGAGWVRAELRNDEDEGQEDELEEDDEQDDGGKTSGRKDGNPDVIGMHVRFGPILRYSVDYDKPNEPFYIETECAWYILRMPAKQYVPYYQHFYTPRRIAQIVISTALKYPQQSLEAFMDRFLSLVDIFGKTYTEEYLQQSITEIQGAVTSSPSFSRLKATTLIQTLLRNASPSIPRHISKQLRLHVPPCSPEITGNLDLYVLKPENQTTTHVTPGVSELARGLVREELLVVGAPPPRLSTKVVEMRKKRERERLLRVLQRAVRAGKRNVDHRREDRIQRSSRYVTAIMVDGEIFRVGDYVIVPKGLISGAKDMPFLPQNEEAVPANATLDMYFWFALIQYINIEDEIAHVQWLEHGKQIYLGELGSEQELFLNDLCGHVPLRTLTAKLRVHKLPESDVPPGDFFYKYKHDKALGMFISLDHKRIELASKNIPPNNCPVCLLHVQQDQETYERPLKDDKGVRNGVSFRGIEYHLDDFVLYRAHEGPAHIGHVVKINMPNRAVHSSLTTVVLRRVGRISDLEVILPRTEVKDERHLFFTDEEVTVDLKDLIRVIFAFSSKSFTAPDASLNEWLQLSSDHFYIRYAFKSLDVRSWNDRRQLSWDELAVCTKCCQERVQLRLDMRDFLSISKKKPLAALDLFGGVGAFSRGLAEGSGLIRVTHAIEISPSAAKTFKRNSPHTIVYNQCTNIMLRYAMKTHEGHKTERPTHIYDSTQYVADPPKPGEIKVVTAGFPCQSHSALNMYKVADDVKSNLILTTLSWIQFLKPLLCFFENVPGFLSYNLNSTQVNQYRVEGGIEMGGLKFLIRALLDLGYQVRFSLLQAGHYGTPQRRVRFFLIAALDGIPLPGFPTPSHDFPGTTKLQIKFPNGDIIRPIRATNGVAPHRFVSIEDAIHDLPRFDWKPSNHMRETSEMRRERVERSREIPALEIKKKSKFCGYKGKVEYYHEPRTSFQVYARAKPTEDLQHYTRCLLPKKVDRVISIPLEADADYRSLRPDQYEWQFANPSSSVARLKYRPGLYGRLDRYQCFPTTVTNVDPTAKQSRVLNPYCKRMVTIRELARSQGFPDHFVFEALGDNLITMHRQIGNAVPLQVSLAIGRELREIMFKKWKVDQKDAMEVDDD